MKYPRMLLWSALLLCEGVSLSAHDASVGSVDQYSTENDVKLQSVASPHQHDDDLSFLDDINLDDLNALPEFQDEPLSIKDMAELAFLCVKLKKNEYIDLISDHFNENLLAYSGLCLMSGLLGGYWLLR